MAKMRYNPGFTGGLGEIIFGNHSYSASKGGKTGHGRSGPRALDDLSRKLDRKR